MLSGSLRVQERFVSLQGEGSLVGVPSSFIRVAGCNLRCTWCDSPASSWEAQGEHMALTEFVAFCARGPRHVVLTGGEPLLFKGVATLARALRAAGHHVTIETAGTVWLDDLECDLISISPKLGHSTPWVRDPKQAAQHERRRLQPSVLSRLMGAFSWQLKFVVRATEAAADLAEIQALPAVACLRPEDRCRVLLMPECTNSDDLRTAYMALLPVCIERGYRLGERLHIHMFGHTAGT